MKKKFLALFLTAALALSITACGKDSSTASTSGSSQTETESSDEESSAETGEDNEDADENEQADAEDSADEKAEVEDPMGAALENMNSITSMETQMVMEMDMTVEADGEKQAIESITTMDMVCFTDPMKIKMEMLVDMGDQGSTSMSIYADSDESGSYTMYMYDGANWSAMPISGAADLADYDARSSVVSTIGDSSAYTLEGTETVNGANAYKYSETLTGEEMQEALYSSGALDSVSSLGLSDSDIYDMLDGLGEIVTYVWVDEATLYPIKYEMDMTDVMDALMVSLVEAMGEQAEGMSMHVPTMKMTMTCSNFNNAADFTVPEEAKAATAE